ncbi:MAG: hypothetical protein PHX62_08870 [Bacilli bacterium]|nr:hypothetical protein [Bacilli bacterium]
MVLIVHHDKYLNLFNNEQFVVLNDICELKHFKEAEYTVLLLDVDINDDGILKELNCFFEEIVISLKIIAIITNKTNEKLREICSFHKLSLLEFQ